MDGPCGSFFLLDLFLVFQPFLLLVQLGDFLVDLLTGDLQVVQLGFEHIDLVLVVLVLFLESIWLVFDHHVVLLFFINFLLELFLLRNKLLNASLNRLVFLLLPVKSSLVVCDLLADLVKGFVGLVDLRDKGVSFLLLPVLQLLLKVCFSIFQLLNLVFKQVSSIFNL